MQESSILDVVELTISLTEDTSHKLVHNLSFTLNRKDRLAIVGESGSGKTLTALSLVGMLPKNIKISKGVINFSINRDIVLNELNESIWQSIRGKEIGFVFQDPMSSLNPVMKIGKQLIETISIHQKISKRDSKQIAIEWLRKVKIQEPELIYNRYPHELSGGQKQRVMIAIAMCNKPQLLIADEPTTALDATVQKSIIQLMLDLQNEIGTAIIFITHDLWLASTFATKLLVLNNGKVRDYGTCEQVIKQPISLYSKALLDCRPRPSMKGKLLPTVREVIDSSVDYDKFNRSINTILKDDSKQQMLFVDKLNVALPQSFKLFGKNQLMKKIVHDVSFVINKGESVGLLGESGCGKTTIAKALLGLIPLASGDIYFEGGKLDYSKSIVRQRLPLQIQFIFQNPFAALNPRRTLFEHLAEPLLFHQLLAKNELNAKIFDLLDSVGLSSTTVDKYPHQFSGGQQQRIVIARALSLTPKLLICDEIVASLDVSVQAQILNLLQELKERYSLSLLFIAHDLAVVHHVSDKILVMDKGNIVEAGSAEQIYFQPQQDFTKALIQASVY